MENAYHAGSVEAREQCLRDAHLHGRSVAAYFIRWIKYYFAEFGSETSATVLEEVAARLAGEAEVLRSGRVRW